MVDEEEVMVEPPLDELDVEALRGGGVAAAAEQVEDVGVRVRGRRRGRTRMREPVGEEVAEWDGRREAARWWRGSGGCGGGGGGSDCEVRKWRELAVHRCLETKKCQMGRKAYSTKYVKAYQAQVYCRQVQLILLANLKQVEQQNIQV